MPEPIRMPLTKKMGDHLFLRSFIAVLVLMSKETCLFRMIFGKPYGCALNGEYYKLIPGNVIFLNRQDVHTYGFPPKSRGLAYWLVFLQRDLQVNILDTSDYRYDRTGYLSAYACCLSGYASHPGRHGLPRQIRSADRDFPSEERGWVSRVD